MWLKDPPVAAPSVLPDAFRPTALWVAAVLALGASSGWAQQSGLSITPTFEATQEFTDNLRLSATDRKAEAITTVTPGIRISSWSGPLQGSLDLGLSGILYASDPSASTLTFDNQTDLSASFKFEVVEQHFFIDAEASITQQSVSAFGLQSTRPSSINDNTTEFRTLTVSPYVRGKLFDGEVDVEGRLTSEYTNSSDDDVGASYSHDASVSFSGGRGAVGWLVRGSRSYSDFEGGRATAEDRIYTQVSYVFDPTLRFFLQVATSATTS
ncbi:MAG: TIGR03016 family PEP-CTERM system-associated outer membrane protein [Rubrivivax sp.]|nr:TIGR03016 family PEP-CTERM system-associated outer membrane protein [Rubrivivax sp.]